MPHELEAKLAINAILNAFPPETDEEFAAQTKNGPEGPFLKVAGGNGGFKTDDSNHRNSDQVF